MALFSQHISEQPKLLRVIKVLFFINCFPAVAEITTDGSLGTAQQLTAPDYQISDSLGRQVGRNLFHSFSKFSLKQNESAIFYGSDNLQNIISRVTGDAPSIINGEIISQPVNANFWFINPNGIVFGKGASLNVGGQTHIATADYLKFDPEHFFNASLTQKSQLSIAPPQAFGFINAVSEIEVDQANLFLESSLDLVAGNINMLGNSTSIDAPGQTINLIAIQQGEVDLSTDSPRLSAAYKRGTVLLRGDESSVLSADDAGVLQIIADEIILDNMLLASESHNGIGGGDIILQSNKLFMLNNAQISSTTIDAGEGGIIDIQATESILIESSGEDLTQIVADTIASGEGGIILIETAKLELKGGSIFAESFDNEQGQSGNAGLIFINVDQLFLTPNAQIGTRTFSNAKGGNIIINATESITVQGSPDQETGIFAGTLGAGDGGELSITSNQLNITEAEIKADSTLTGKTGIIDINAQQIIINPGGIISSTNFGDGEGAELNIIATDKLLIKGDNDSETGIFATHDGNAEKGSDITIKAGLLILDNVADISSNTAGTSVAGSINIDVDSDVIIQNNSEISTQAQTRGGEIKISAKNLIYVVDSKLSAAADGEQRGHNSGNLSLSSAQFVVLNNALLEARALAGDGGKIKISPQNLIVSSGSRIDASSELGVSGEVELEGLTTDINTLVTLPVLKLTPQNSLLENPCQQQRNTEKKQSRLVLEPASPRVVMRNGQLIYQTQVNAKCVH